MTKEILEKLGIEEKLLEKILIILKEGVFWDCYGNRYDSPCLYYNGGWELQDACTGYESGIEKYGKLFARTLEEIEKLKGEV